MNSPLNPVVVGVVGQQPYALQFAADEAHLRQTALRVVHSAGNSAQVADFYAGNEIYDALQQAGREILQEAQEAVDADGRLSGTTYSLSARTPVDLLESESLEAALLIVGSDEINWLDRLLGGSVTGRLAFHAHCPLVVVQEPNFTPTPTETVVVALDGEEADAALLTFAFEWADLHHLDLRVLHATDPRWLPADLRIMRANISEVLAGWREMYPEVTVHLEFASADPEDACVRATGTADLIVMGRPSRRSLPFLSAGSIVPHVISAAHCPIAIIPGA
ncbi:hypothetical protein C6I20_06750 [Aeromicrobium sp. A1-2]|uniref:universal stress protein n=1 Tax=Aeromicrobium sp. A1-2 TaxID=2107713 RepID=UPI000E4D3A93|nr:universal stress protein [Aeromicrobium sp. A1-2]AXT84917.1 hypothetical protein C6I20_06750 [Aeromicrobium sp. A1-2]